VKLVIVSPQSKHEYVVQWIEAHTPTGTLFIKPGHAPIILTLAAGADFSFLLPTDEKKIIRLIRPGFLEINRTSALALISQETTVLV
jgi:F0F1-type ATP synthase epsilon subunit